MLGVTTPEPGTTYHDALGRELVVTEHRSGDTLNRDVIGTVRNPDGSEREYATSDAIFAGTWAPLDATPPQTQWGSSAVGF